MAIRGSLSEASLPDVLQLLSMGKKSGCLSVTHRSAFGSVYFDRGRISFASIVNRRDRLGDLLVSNGLLSRADLDAAVALQGGDPGRRLGEILISRDLISREELHQYIRRQIEEAVYFLFTWTQGTFSFEPDVVPDEQDFLVSINPESLLLEGARRIDEWELIQKKVPGLDSVFALDRGHLAASRVALTMEQETLLPLIDGVRDVHELVDASGLGEFEVGKALFGLATAGFLHRVGRRKATTTPSEEGRVVEHRNLGVAFYKSGMLDEAAREFRRVLDLRPGDALSEFHLGLIAARQGAADDAIRAFSAAAARSPQAGAAHANLAFALERVGRLTEAQAALAMAQRALPDDPGVRLTAAVLALHRGEVQAADGLLRAIEARPDRRAPLQAPWYHYAGIAALRLGQVDRAIAVLAEGVAAHPHAAVLANNLAVALEVAGRLPEAASVLERGLLEGPGVAALHKNAGDLHFAAGRMEDALDAFSRAVRLSPELGPDVWQKLGNIRELRGEREDAMRCWERARALRTEAIPDPASAPA